MMMKTRFCYTHDIEWYSPDHQRGESCTAWTPEQLAQLQREAAAAAEDEWCETHGHGPWCPHDPRIP